MCAWIAWTPAWDFNAEAPVPYHYFYEDDLPKIVAFHPEMEVCQPSGEWDVPHTYVVQGGNANEVGPISDSLTVVWLVPEPGQTLQLLAGFLCIVAFFVLSRMWLDRS
jgi:hypothetical protein